MLPLWRFASVRVLTRGIQTQPRFDYVLPETGEPSYIPAGAPTPRQLVRYIDQYVVGQESAKKVLSVAVFNHYNRVRANLSSVTHEQSDRDWSDLPTRDMRVGVSPAHIYPHPHRLHENLLKVRQDVPLFEKSNVLVIGPTGSGKTLLARTLARVLDVPFSVSDATSFTQAGYIGEDVDMAIQRLLQAADWDPLRASTGIVYIDEVDKIARKSSGSGIEGSRDVGGEGVQQALLRMMEGSVVTVQTKGSGSVDSPLGGDGRSRSGQRNSNPGAPKPESYHIDTSNVLFILSGAFVGLDSIIRRRMAQGSIGFTANLRPPEDDNAEGFVPFFTANNKRTPPNNILSHVEPSDLVKYGFIPEFVSRLPSITSLSPLTIPDLRRILTEVRGSLISQYTSLFGYSSVEIRFTGRALNEICRRAAERGGGARGLRGIMETILLDPMYEVPGSNIRYVLIDEATARGESPPRSWTRAEGADFWMAWAEEESP